MTTYLGDLITPLNTDPGLSILLTVAGVVLAVFFALGHWAGRRSGRAESVTAALTEAEARRVAMMESATRVQPAHTAPQLAALVATGQASTTAPAADVSRPLVFEPLPAPPERPSVEVQQVIRTPVSEPTAATPQHWTPVTTPRDPAERGSHWQPEVLHNTRYMPAVPSRVDSEVQ